MDFKCSECGKIVAASAKFCPHCGASFDDAVYEEEKKTSNKAVKSSYDSDVDKTSKTLISLGKAFAIGWYVVAGLIFVGGLFLSLRSGDEEVGFTIFITYSIYSAALVFVGLAVQSIYRWMTLVLQGIKLIKNKK